MPLVPIAMPQLGESIAEATIRVIRAAVGTNVQADQEVLEVETQKATLGVTVPCAGRLAEWRAELDQTYPVGTILGFIETTVEEAQRAGLDLPEIPTANPSSLTSAVTAGEEKNLHFRYDSGDIFAANDEPPRVEPIFRGLPVPANATGASYLSPRMRVRMQELGINAADLSAVAGTGEAGRVTIEDFERFISTLEQHEMSKASPMRVAVADAMRRSWTRPLATVGLPVALDAVLLHRKNSNPKPGTTLYAIRALALALGENSACAGRLVGGRIVHPTAIDIGFAVEVNDGVLVPIIRNVDQKPLATLLEFYNQLVERGRQRKLGREEMTAGAATVTNYGSFGIQWATPIPLPEQNLVLGLGAGRKVPVWNETKQNFEPITEAQLTLSFDHRVLDGGAAGRLLQRIATLLQKPEAL